MYILCEIKYYYFKNYLFLAMFPCLYFHAMKANILYLQNILIEDVIQDLDYKLMESYICNTRVYKSTTRVKK